MAHTHVQSFRNTLLLIMYHLVHVSSIQCTRLFKGQTLPVLARFDAGEHEKADANLANKLTHDM
jgi:hypothetical protein